jgi:hypothetical protein
MPAQRAARPSPGGVACFPIFIARALEVAGFRIQTQEHRRIWVPVEVVLAIKEGGGEVSEGPERALRRRRR